MERTGNGADFDGRAFMARLEQRRAELAQQQRAAMSWRQVGAQASVSPAVFTRLYRGHRPDAVTLGRLLEWLGDKPWWMTTAP